MKKLLILFCALMVCFSCVCNAANVGPTIPTSTKIQQLYTEIWKDVAGAKTRVGLVYVNNAKTTYDDDIDFALLKPAVQTLAPVAYTTVDATSSLSDFYNMGVNDLGFAERNDIIDILKNFNLDYAILMQVDPFIRKERESMFRYTIEMTSNITFKIIDIKGNRYLYNGKIIEFAKHGTALGGVSNKSTVMKVLAKVDPQIKQTIGRIPK